MKTSSLSSNSNLPLNLRHIRLSFLGIYDEHYDELPDLGAYWVHAFLCILQILVSLPSQLQPYHEVPDSFSYQLALFRSAFGRL